MSNVIACRIASYGEYQETAWVHLPTLGIRHVEIPVPSPDDVELMQARLDRSGLTASSVQTFCRIADDNLVDAMTPQLEACHALGARIAFVSIKAGDLDRTLVWTRIRAVADVAARLGITLAMETHPDLITNGRTALETIRAIDHPNVRVNFDTANIYFYNHDMDAVTELQTIAPYVVSMHLKDSRGGYRQFDFPPLGEGIVDFPAIFRLMAAHGFSGPFTMELEGTEGVRLDEASTCRQVAQSVAYLRRIGAFT